MKKIAIIGAGASGLICAIELAKKDYDISIFDKNSKIGRKLLATGNGRCNITNKNLSKKFYHTYNNTFITTFLKQFSFSDIKKLFLSLGIEFIEEKNGKIFPMSNSANSIVEAIKFELNSKQNISLYLNTQIEYIEKDNKKFMVNKTYFDKVIIATGSIAMKKLGASDIGYKIAEKFGHTIIEPFASLVQLVVDDKDISIASGVKVDAILNGKIQGDLLFTKYGLSGNSILDISRDYSYELTYNKSVKLSIELLPDITKDKLISILRNRIKNLPNKPLDLWLDGIFNIKLARYIIKKANIKKEFSKELNKKDILHLVYTIKNLTIYIVDTKGFEYAEVAAGGVDTTQIDSKTFESKLVKNLYFLGEVLDVDGDCGGYNLHFAFGSGYLCAKNILSTS